MAHSDRGQVVDFKSLDVKDQELIRKAVAVRENAFCPISHFKVGAALRTEENVTITGCNVESYVFAPSVCAERTAICKGVSEGHTKFKTVAVAAFQENQFTPPCGVCRQMLSEFCVKGTTVYMTKPDMQQVFCIKLEELLPLAFTSYP